MALLFCDGFDHYASADLATKWDTSNSNGCFSINTSIKRSGPSSLRFEGKAGDWNNVRTVKRTLGVNKGSVAIGYDCYVDNLASGRWGVIRFYDGSTVQVELRLNNNLTISAYKGAGDVGLGSTSTCFSLDTHFFLEVKVVFSDTAGSVEIKVNGVTVLLTTGVATVNTANAYCNGVGVGGTSYDPNVCTIYFDDMYVAEDFLGDVKVETIYPSGVGSTTEWAPLSGNNWENVDEATPDGDTSYVSSGTVDAIDVYTFANLTAPSGDVLGIQVNITAKKDDAGNRGVSPIVRPSDTNNEGATTYLATSYAMNSQVFPNNPDTSQAWTVTDINNTQFGIKCKE